jgi:hypothetical protein
MYHSLIARAVGAAAGGLLGSALLPVAVAFADDYAIVPDPSSVETITSINGGQFVGVPQLPWQVEGSQLYDIDDTTVGTSTNPDVVATFDADEATVAGSYGNQELLVTSDVSGTVGTAAGDAPPVGSVFDTNTFGAFGSLEYSALASTTPGGDVVSYQAVTPFGTFNLPDFSYDAASGLATDSLATVPVPFVGSYEFVPDAAAAPEAVTAINGLPPVGIIVQGDTVLNMINTADGTTADPDVVGTFDVEKAATHDFGGDHSEALLVTSDVSGTPGTAAGDIPPVDSLYNIFYLGDTGIESVYSDLPTASGGDDINWTIVTPNGDYNIPLNFAASEVLTTSPVPIGTDYNIVADPGSTETFTAVNGNAPLALAVQGQQLFDVDHGTGTSPDVAGTFNGDVTTAANIFGTQGETILVTSDVSGTTGTAVGDVPLPGSVIDTSNLGSGWENIYSDLVSTTGTNVISDTLVTPLGDITTPLTSAADVFPNLAADMFAMF